MIGLAYDIIRTAWGSSHNVKDAPHTKVNFGSNWEVWKKANNAFWAAAFTGEKTITNSGASGAREILVQWGIDNAAPTEPEEAYFIIKSSPRLAEVFIDGLFTGIKTNTDPFFVIAGPRTIRLEKAGYKSAEKTVTAVEGVTKTIEFRLFEEEPEKPPEKPPGTGRLKVLVTSKGESIAAKVTVLGLRSYTSPTPFIELKIGKEYTLNITKDGYQLTSVRITVPYAGDFTESYELMLLEEAPEPPPEAERPPLWSLIQLIWGDEAESIWQLFAPVLDPLTAVIDFVTDEIPGPTINGQQMPGIPIFVVARAPLAVATKALPVGIQAAIKTGAEKASQAAAGEISEWGTRDFAGLGKWVTSLAPAQRQNLFRGLSQYGYAAGDRATDTLVKAQLSLLETAGFTNITKALKTIAAPILLVGAAVGTKEALSWFHKELPEIVSFPLRDLIQKGKWKEAEALLPAYRSLVTIATNFLRATGFEEYLGFPIWQGYADGYDAQQQNWERQIFDGLEKEAVGTTISVSTNVDPAFASIENRFTMKQTPFTFNIEAGDYDLTVEKEGYVPKTKRIFPKVNEDLPVTFTLEEISEDITLNAGRLQLTIFDKKTSAAIKGTLFIDGRAEQFHLHSYSMDMKAGAYEIKVQEPGYKIYSDTIAITEGQITNIRVELDKFEAPPDDELPEDIPDDEKPEVPQSKGSLEVSSDPKASVWIGGNEVLSMTPGIVELFPGVVDVTFKAEGYVSETWTAFIRAGEITALGITLKAEDAPPTTRKLARVTVRSEPSGAKILLNGTFIKKYTPDSVLLEAGEYQFCISKTGFVTKCVPLKLVEE